MTIIQLFVWGFFGGLLAELLHWVGLKDDPNIPTYFWSLKYWIITGLLVIAGALLTVAFGSSGNELTPLSSIAVGYSAPSVIKNLAKLVPSPTLGSEEKVRARPSSLGFLKG